MAKYSNTKAKINEKIATNTVQAITGNILNDVLQTMVDSLGADYLFGGLVQPGSTFTAGEQPVVFIATTPGTYTNFGSLVVADGEVALLVWSGTAWSKQTPDIATRTELNQLGQKVDGLEELEGYVKSEDGTYQQDITGTIETGFVGTNGTVNSTNTSYKRTDYIPVSEGDDITATGGIGETTGYTLAAFDTNKAFISNSPINKLGNNGSAKPLSTYTVTIPSGTAYIIVSQRPSYNGGVLAISVKKTSTVEHYFIGDFFPNKSTLDKFSEDNGKLLFNSEPVLKKDSLTIAPTSDNMANPANIQDGKLISSSGNIATNADWSMIRIPVTPGNHYTFGGFHVGVGHTGNYAFYNGTTKLSYASFYEGSDGIVPVTVIAPVDATDLYIDIRTPDSPENPYQFVQVNVGDTFLDYDAYNESVTKILDYDLNGGGADPRVPELVTDVAKLQTDVAELQAGISGVIVDLPVSDGSDISQGYAYIHSTTGVVTVKL